MKCRDDGNEWAAAKLVQKWFRESVTCDDEPYIIDLEQALAVVNDSKNTIVVARAGSGKTRTIVAKIVYLVARCNIRPDEILVFVFNANAAAEINARLSRMRVDGDLVMGDTRVASTFHAFSRKMIYRVCGYERECGEILAGEKEKFILVIIRTMLGQSEWLEKIKKLIADGGLEDENDGAITEEDLMRLVRMMTSFIDRAQQRFLGGDKGLGDSVRDYLKGEGVEERERIFLEVGAECYKRYHWYLLNGKRRLVGFESYGTDFNLIVSWASKLIYKKSVKVKRILSDEKYILIDEYQDFSQLFLAAVLAIREVAVGAKLFVVGDDWQAINRFAGSEVRYFKNFEEFFPDDCKRVEISTNYRCDRMIVSEARKFMVKAMLERGNFRAHSRRLGNVVLVNPEKVELGYALVKYDNRISAEDRIYREAIERVLGKTPKKITVKYLKTVVQIIRRNKRRREILFLHRNNEMDADGVALDSFAVALRWSLAKLKIMDEIEFNAKIRVMTMHKSKGLEAEVVVILEADEGIIPKMHPDTELYKFFGEMMKEALDDQKRLFYVAMTRAKGRLYIMHKKAKRRKDDGFIRYLSGSLRYLDEV